MIRNYFRLLFKQLGKQKVFSLINILGLTVSITCCLMIFLYIKHEYSYDDFHKKAADIYRVVRVADGDGEGSNQDIAWVSGPYAKALKNDYPGQIERAVRVQPDNDLFQYKDVSFNEKNVYLVDSDFFKLFDFRLLKGSPSTVLTDPNSVVITESTAKKYFGKEDPIGKVMEMNKKQPLKVTGVTEDLPSNSEMEFDLLVPISGFKYMDSTKNFPYNGLFTYIQLKPTANPQQLMTQLPQFMDKYLGQYYAQNGFKMHLNLEPLRDIYFKELLVDHLKHGSKKTVFIFLTIALLILAIACINFMNLATARVADRSKEVGLRKVLGAVRRQLVWQFILESFMYATLSSILALLLLQSLMPAYTQLLGYKLTAFWTDPMVYAFLGGVIVLIGFLAGLYPALLLSSFSPIESLKGKLRVGQQGVFFRKALVVFQFSVSVLLIIGIIIISRQMSYVKHTDLGFNREQSVLVKIDNNDIYENKANFKTEVQSDPNVLSVSLMSGEPGGFHDRQGFEAEARPGEKLLLNTEFADFQYVKALGLTIIAGRDLSAEFPTDSAQAVLINREAATTLGYSPQQAIGKWVRNLGNDTLRRTIVGVVENYHFASLKEAIQPIVIAANKDWRLALIRLRSTQHLPATLSHINKAYAAAAPGFPFEYDFLDETFNQHYKDDIKQGTILTVFSSMAIFIACLGLFGLASYTAFKRTKEIGVRKVLGSSVRGIVILLSKDLLKPVLLGTVIAIPAGYYFMKKWLDNYAYRIHIEWWMFVIAALMAIVIALLTISFQALKAALVNPVKSLRTE